MKKYELTHTVRILQDRLGNERRLYQVRALQDITLNKYKNKYKKILKGMLGGYIESEKNLSQEGTCWLDENSFIFNDAILAEDAYVESSYLYDEVVVKGKAFLVDTIVSHTSIICEKTFVRESSISLDSVIAAPSNIFDSNLSNVRIRHDVEKPENQEWACYFEKVFLKSEEPIYFNGACDWNKVHLFGDTIRVQAETNLSNVFGLNIKVFQVFASLTMKNTTLGKDTVFSIPRRKSGNVKIIGSIESERGIVINSDGIRLINSQMYGEVQIHGSWMLENTRLHDCAVLKNESNRKHILLETNLQDFSEVTCQKTYTGEAVKMVIQLDTDEQFIIR